MIVPRFPGAAKLRAAAEPVAGQPALELVGEPEVTEADAETLPTPKKKGGKRNA